MLAEIVGHEAPLKVLRRAVATGRVHHAYLFVGPPNVGKTLTALQFAKVLNCERHTAFADETEVECCDECSNCHGIEVGNHPDFRLIQPVARIGDSRKSESDEAQDSDQVGSLELDDAMIYLWQVAQIVGGDAPGPDGREQSYTGHVNMRLASGRQRAYVFANADQLNPDNNGANRLLKTLEEPPPHTVFVLTATSPAKLLPTIVSRCQVINFRPVPVVECEGFLARRFPQADAAQVRTVAGLSGGRIGWACRLLQHPEVLKLREVAVGWCLQLKTMEQVECLRLGEQIVELVEEWWLATGADKDTAEKALKQARDRVLRTVFPDVLDVLSTWFRDLVLVGAAPEAPQVINQDHLPDLRHQAPLYSPAACRKVVLHIEELKRQLRQNANVRLAAEVLALRMLTA